jgi:ABC-type uncharacterized transport system permease subunit
MEYPLFSIIAVMAYAVAGVLLYQGMLHSNSKWKNYAIYVVSAGLAAHAGLLAGYWLESGVVDVSASHILSACSWFMVLSLVGSRFFDHPLVDSGLIAFPLAGLIVLLDFLLPHAPMPLESMTPGTRIHVLSSVSAFAFLGIAAFYALFISMLDRYLRRNKMTAITQALPALEILETLLMRLVLVGFILLTTVLITGLVYVDNLLAQHLVHKTVLSFIAWAIYGILLFGRWRFGWRGRTAVRLTLAATIVLLLSYFGSKLVLEQFLGQNWQV